MRKITGTFLIILISGLALFAQTGSPAVLLIGHGPVARGEQSEIMHYCQKNGIDIKWLDGNRSGWEDINHEKYPILWIHRADSAGGGGFEDENDFYSSVISYTEKGGSVLLTQHAMDFLNKSGLESIKVEHRSKTSEDNGYGRMLGFHAFISHPIFDGLNGGAYIWKPPYDTTVTQCGFFDDNVPLNGKVIAVDWDYIFVREKSKILVEYKVGKGRILGIGAYFNLSQPNTNSMHYDVFYNNVFDYLLGKKDQGESHYWLYGEQNAAPLDFVLFRQYIPSPAKKWKIERSWLTLGREQAKHEYCEVAGRRMLLAAYEPGGIFELWAHPFMAFRDYKAMIYFGSDTIVSLNELTPEIAVNPASIQRSYVLYNGARIVETMVVSPDRPVGAIHYEYEGPEAKLLIQYKSNMRMMWPYAENVLKTFKYGYQPGLNAFEITAPEGSITTLIGASRIPSGDYAGPCIKEDHDTLDGTIFKGELHFTPDSIFGICAGQYYELGQTDYLDIVFAAGSEDRDTLIGFYMKALQDPEQLYNDALKQYQGLQDHMLSLSTPDENFNKGYAWALAATDRFFVNTPGLGNSLVAGYNGTDRGWDGGHAVNGRPGYAWYFGRDAVWSSFAVLDYGDYEGVKDVLNMLIKYQDLNGKIFHELSTSGFVHYDASDATPLFIILAGRTLRYSGDLDYLKSIWPAIEKAIDYCRSTDTDGDGLIENTNVGHGWVEGGPLFGSHTSLYLASCWAEALAEASFMSAAMGMINEPATFLNESNKVIEKIRTDMFNFQTGFSYQGIYPDGSFHTGESILPSIPVYFGHIPGVQAGKMLQAFASGDYTADWGVRMAPQSAPYYHPRSYHSGSVWPLFTGWVALAEYKMNRPVQGFMHIMNNLNIYRDFSLGYLEEVLSGERYAPSGVCPHQCWSETMVLQPVIEGMLGIRPDATQNRLHLSPSIPFAWDTVSVSNIRCRDRYVDWSMYRWQDTTIFHFSGGPDEKLDISFEPSFPHGTIIANVWINDEEIPLNIYAHENGIRVKAELELSGHAVVKVSHHGGIELIPPVVLPLRNEASSGVRIINTSWENNTFTILAEGTAGMHYELELINNLGDPVAVGGATYNIRHNTLVLGFGFPAMQQGYQRHRITIEF